MFPLNAMKNVMCHKARTLSNSATVAEFKVIESIEEPHIHLFLSIAFLS
jgi:hypothetical protein